MTTISTPTISTPTSAEELKKVTGDVAVALDALRSSFVTAVTESIEAFAKKNPGPEARRIRDVMYEMINAVNDSLRDAESAADDIPRRARQAGMQEWWRW